MKKILIFAGIILAGMMFGCEPGDETSGGDPAIVFGPLPEFTFDGGTGYIDVTTVDSEWKVSTMEGSLWCKAARTGDRIELKAADNMTPNPRTVRLRVTGAGTTREVSVRQGALAVPGNYYSDGQVVALQEATKGHGADIVLVGDGYTLEDMKKADGKYEADMRLAAEHFFSVYPYDAYRDHFNVWMVTAVSGDKGISQPGAKLDTVFESEWAGGNSTAIGANAAIVKEYAAKATMLAGKPHPGEQRVTSNTLVIMPINDSEIYAGTAEIEADGFSMVMCPTNATYFRNIVMHEAGGHGFANLCDEYIHYDQQIPQEVVQHLMSGMVTGYYCNVDFTSDYSEVAWAGFADDPEKYRMVGTFEGGYNFTRGIWRPEQNSCMNNNVPYYNAPSRYEQVKRIMARSGVNSDYTLEQFMADDVVPDYDKVVNGGTSVSGGVLASRSVADLNALPPLAPPVFR